MPENKKHHYVPRFYLKRFSGNGKSINVYNLKSKTKILNGNLKNQCYKNYLYGNTPEIEKALSTLEGEAARLFRRIDTHQSLPSQFSAEHIILAVHVLAQHSRTTYAADAIDDMLNRMMQHIFKEKAKLEGFDLSQYFIGIQDPARYSVGMSLQFFPLLLDLKYKLLINNTNCDLIASDNPVVFYNQFFSFSSRLTASKQLQCTTIPSMESTVKVKTLMKSASPKTYIS